MPHHASGTRLEIYGSKDALVIASTSVNLGQSQPQLGIGMDEMKEIVSPTN